MKPLSLRTTPVILSAFALSLGLLYNQPVPARAANLPQDVTKEQGAPSKAASGQLAAASKYAGADECKVCHDDIYKNFESSPHWKTRIETGL
jgi:hypothetical protein